MTLTDLLEQLEGLRITPQLGAGGDIRLIGPKGALTPELLEALRDRKPELQAHLADKLLGVSPEREPGVPWLAWAEGLLAEHGRVWLESPEDPLDYWRFCGQIDSPAVLAAWRARCESWTTWGALTAKGTLLCVWGELPESFLNHFHLVPDEDVELPPEALSQEEA